MAFVAGWEVVYCTIAAGRGSTPTLDRWVEMEVVDLRGSHQVASQPGAAVPGTEVRVEGEVALTREERFVAGVEAAVVLATEGVEVPSRSAGGQAAADALPVTLQLRNQVGSSVSRC